MTRAVVVVSGRRLKQTGRTLTRVFSPCRSRSRSRSPRSRDRDRPYRRRSRSR